MKITEVKRQIEEIERILETVTEERTKRLLKDELFNLRQEQQRKQVRREQTPKRELEIKLGRITKELEEAQKINDLQKYKELEKEKRKVNKALNETKKKFRYLTVGELRRIISRAETLRDKSIIALAFEGGLRATELINFKIGYLNQGLEEIETARLKGSIDCKMKISAELNDLLGEYINEYSPKEYLFTSQRGNQLTLQGLDYIFKKICKSANIFEQKRHFHILKHTRGVWLSENGFTLQEIKQLLGHKEIKNTMIYATFSKTQRENIEKKLEGKRYF